MKKNFGILLALMLIVSMTACGNAKTTNEASAEKEEVSNEIISVEQTKTNEIQNSEETTILTTVYPVNIVTYDADGNEVIQTINKAPERIITNNLSMTEVLIDLGLTDKIVGMLNPDNEIDNQYASVIETIPHIGDKKSVSKEVVMTYEPEIIMGRNAMFSEKSFGTVEAWNEIGTLIYSQKSSLTKTEQVLDNIVEDVKNIGIIFDIQETANEYADSLQARIDSVVNENNIGDAELKNALIMCAFTGETFGAYKSALQECVLNKLGYTNVATGTSDLTLENLVTMNPELIIYVTSNRNAELDTYALEKMTSNDVIGDVPAIFNNKIMTITYDELMDYGPAVISAFEKINTFVHE